MNTITLDLSKVQWGKLEWENQDGIRYDRKPKGETAHGCSFHPDMLANPHPDYPNETMIERATRLGILDHWKPITTFQLSANHNVVFTNKKALAMWRAWQTRIFGKKGTK